MCINAEHTSAEQPLPSSSVVYVVYACAYIEKVRNMYRIDLATATLSMFCRIFTDIQREDVKPEYVSHAKVVLRNYYNISLSAWYPKVQYTYLFSTCCRCRVRLVQPRSCVHIVVRLLKLHVLNSLG